MRFRELFETPQWIEPTQFNLDNPEMNKKFAADQLTKASEIIEDTADYKMIRTGDGNNGWIFLYNISKQTADYVVQYKARNWNWLPQTVTQCVLWNNPASQLIRNATTRMFFGYLLQNYPAIMSDRLQTDNGHRFWQRRMADAANRNYHIGVANTVKHTVNWYDPTGNLDIDDWLRGQDSFGKDERYQNMRYIVAN